MYIRSSQRIFRKYYVDFILDWRTKCAIFLIFLIYLVFAIWGILTMEQGWYLRRILIHVCFPNRSWLRKVYFLFAEVAILYLLMIRSILRLLLKTDPLVRTIGVEIELFHGNDQIEIAFINALDISDPRNRRRIKQSIGYRNIS